MQGLSDAGVERCCRMLLDQASVAGAGGLLPHAFTSCKACKMLIWSLVIACFWTRQVRQVLLLLHAFTSCKWPF